MDVNVFYGKREQQVVILPPKDCNLSDANLSELSDNEAKIDNMKIPSEEDDRNSSRELRRFIHFANNAENQGSNDRLCKIRSLLNSVRDQCRNLHHETHHSIDEMMVPYKSRTAGNLRQYIENKPHKWCYKLFVRCGVSGIIYDLVPYTGKEMITELSEEKKKFGIGGQVIILYKTIATEKGNEYQLSCQSTCIAVKWVDNKVVTLANSFVGVEPLGSVQRWNATEERKVNVNCSTNTRAVYAY
ncbi:hypothetical protein ILUMI_04740 [Ignelater luminosus]|uniref:PiggyBac transposable element-derived protein domain-containing protein n=1 Tax=Ignelater luminosus TaxID=2038154 RepID=A0A8K0D8K7_IGNLU|nr:hypothetical protein ILUMI_04740 [Ignelater luminosus]